MSIEPISGAVKKLPAWPAECFSALADALATDDDVQRREFVERAIAADAVVSSWMREGAMRDAHTLARCFSEFRIAPAVDSESRRFQLVLRMRLASADLEDRFEQALDEAKLAALAEFAAGAGHEMNNPLAVISGRAQLLLRGETDDARRADLALIKAQATRVHEMIADLMLFARPPAPVKKRVDLVATVRTAVDTVRAAANQKRVELMLTLPDAPVWVEIDESQWIVVIRALVENALNASPAGQFVSVILDAASDAVQLTVRDQGPGISPEERKLIFDPYYSGRQAGRGLGMGLPKCWRLIQQHGGELTVENAPGGGAVFRIRQ